MAGWLTGWLAGWLAGWLMDLSITLMSIRFILIRLIWNQKPKYLDRWHKSKLKINNVLSYVGIYGIIENNNNNNNNIINNNKNKIDF